MQQFSFSAKLYIWAVIAAGALSFVFAARLGEAPAAQWPVLLGLCGVTGAASLWKVRLFGKADQATAATMSLGFVPTFFTLLYFGPLFGMITASVGMIVTTRVLSRSYYYQVLFSVATVALAAFAAGLILEHAGLGAITRVGSPPGAPEWPARWMVLAHQFPAIFQATLTYYVLNTVSVAAAIALTLRQNPLATWRGHFLWTGPGYLAGASCATILFGYIGDGLHRFDPWAIFGSLAVVAPILWVIYYTCRIYMEKIQASERHIEELQQGKRELEQLYLSTVKSLALAIEAKDRYTHEHILRVEKVAVAIAQAMGVSGDDLQGIRTAALLHDIGKLGVPEHILVKPGKLTPGELDCIREHPDLGSKILTPVQFPWPVLPGVRSHHEKWDGSGYPDHLTGEHIPLAGRIMAVADVYDALTSERSYRDGWSHEAARDHIVQNAGSHFDPVVVDAFERVMAVEPSLRKGSEKENVHAPGAAGASQQIAADINRSTFEYISLYEISQTVSVTLSLPETLALLAGKIHKIFGSAACVLLLAPDEGRDAETATAPVLLRAEIAVGANAEYFGGATLRRGEGGVSERVFSSGEGQVSDYDRGDLLLASGGAHTPWTPLRSALVVPLLGAERQILGTINLYHERAQGFDAQDLRVLLAVSAQAGRAIENARTFERTRESALTDSLTGLHNARYLQLFLEQEIFRALHENRPLSVLVLDLDNFKPVNDTFGHARGNEVLKELGALMQSSLRADDLFARYAGDEFVAVLPGTDPGEAQIVASKIQNVVAGYYARAGTDLGGIQIGISVGAASLPGDAMDAATLIACADAAMYRDKTRHKAAAAAARSGSDDAGGDAETVAADNSDAASPTLVLTRVA